MVVFLFNKIFDIILKMKRISTSIQKRLAGLAGMIGPLLFVAVFTIEGAFRPGFSSQMVISDLSLGPRGWIQDANFMILGILFILFAWGVYLEFKNDLPSRLGPVILAAIAISIFFSGLFITDPPHVPSGPVTLHGSIHVAFGVIAFLSLPISCFVFTGIFRDSSRWRPFYRWTLISGIIVTALVMIFTITEKLPVTADALYECKGFFQRAAIIAYFLWIFTFALNLYKINKKSTL